MRKRAALTMVEAMSDRLQVKQAGGGAGDSSSSNPNSLNGEPPPAGSVVVRLPVDPARLNAVGDLVLTEAREFRALADPLRLTLFDVVRRRGPITSSALARSADQDRASIDDHLRELESLGLIERERLHRGDVRWRTGVQGVYFEIPDDPEGQCAARQLSNVMLAQYATLPVAWVRDEEPKLDVEWARAAGLLNARVDLTADELREVQEGLERLLEPYTTRSAGDMPVGVAGVRIIAYFMPEAGRDRPSEETL